MDKGFTKMEYNHGDMNMENNPIYIWHKQRYGRFGITQ